MAVRPITPLEGDLAGHVRPSVRLERVMQILDADERSVRRLIDRGELQAHGIGKRGVRIYLDSVLAYQESRAITPKEPQRNIQAKRKTVAQIRRSASRAALRASGILP